MGEDWKRWARSQTPGESDEPMPPRDTDEHSEETSSWTMWRDVAASKNATEELDEPDDDKDAVLDVADGDQPVTTPGTKSLARKAAYVIFAVSLCLTIGGVIWAFKVFTPSSPDTVSASPAPETTTEIITTTQETTTSVPAPVKCPHQVKADEHTPEGAVVAWNTAYFSGDADELTSMIAPDSYLKDTDWGTLLADQVGATWCAKTKKISDTEVQASVTAKLTNGNEVLYPQNYTLVQRDGRYLVAEIENRAEGKTK